MKASCDDNKPRITSFSIFQQIYRNYSSLSVCKCGVHKCIVSLISNGTKFYL